MATTKITSPELFDLGSLNTALKLPSGTTAQRPTSPSTGEWRYNTTTNLVEFYDGAEWLDLQSEDIPPINSENFNTVLYTGNGSTQSITGVGFKPDWVWIKRRDGTENHYIQDSTRGSTNQIYSNLTNAQFNEATAVTSFDADGFTMGNYNGINNSGETYVAWCWKANGGTTSSNTDGTITSTVQANTKAKFSIVSYTGNAVSGATIGHGLGVEPDLVIVKNLNLSTQSWNTYIKNVTTTNAQFLTLNTNAANGNTANPRFIPGNFSSSVFSVGNDNSTNGVSGVDTYIAYCFSSVAGYSSIGSYTGNASPNGPLVVTGFEPALLIVKNTSGTSNWRMVDNKRNPLNHRQRALFPNLNNAEGNDPNDAVDFLSTGFKISNDDPSWNANADQFIYIAFASDPTAAPTLADSFANKSYTGNATSNRAITGLGFSPSWVWIKNRVAARDHMEFDNVRLLGSELVPGNYTNLDAADFNTTANDFNSFDTDGFTVGQDPYTNENGSDMIAWTWKANPIPAINNDGDIQSIVSANQAAGFSIATYTGNSTSGATVGHGLSAAPDAVIIKCMNTGSTNWINYYETIGVNDYLTLNLNNALDTFSNWFASNATTFTLNNTFGNANTSGRTYVAYCFKSTAGFSKMGSYSGTGSAGNAQNVGFTPAWVMIKRTNSISDWYMFDTARGDTSVLLANSSAAQFTNTNFNLTSTGFDFDGTDFNEAGSSWIYMAFKENPAQYAIPSGQMGYLVAAGGGGSSADSGGGAGAGGGGLRTTYGLTSGGGASAETNLTLATGTYTITVGAGGAAYDGVTTAQNGVASTITGVASVSTVGGGAGGDFLKSGTAYKGNAGGSGGGSANSNGALTLAGGAGTANEGFAGGGGFPAGSGLDANASGGGGGSAQVGVTATSGVGGNGGNGLNVAITGSNAGYAGGGGGGCRGTSGTTAGQGGNGGGGNAVSTGNGNPGAANTGGGAGGGRADGANGGSGVVILRLNTSDYSGVTSGAPTITTIGSETILKYTASGGYAHNYNIPAGSMAYLVVAGGGGSGNEGSSFTTSGAGGGAGGLRTSYGLASGGGTSNESFLTLSAGTYTITIGSGGGIATNGSASTITGNGSVATVGGGGGGQNSVGSTGGSGGGGGSNRTGPIKYNGGAGTTGEGFGGSIGDVFFWSAIANDFAAGGGGGGAESAAVTTNAGTTGAAGEGGNGLPVGITGSNNYYSAGGGGFRIGLPVNGAGHHSEDGGSIENGQPNTGDGAPKWGGLSGFSGGSGVVVLRMKTTDYSGTTTGSPTVSTDGSDTVLTFTGSGTYVHS